MVQRSENRAFRPQAKKTSKVCQRNRPVTYRGNTFQVFQRHREHIVVASWQALSSLRAKNGSEPVITDVAATEFRRSFPENDSTTDEDPDDAQVREFEDSIIDAMHGLYQLSASPK